MPSRKEAAGEFPLTASRVPMPWPGSAREELGAQEEQSVDSPGSTACFIKEREGGLGRS